MQIGIDSFVSTIQNSDTGVPLTAAQRIQNLLGEIEHADRVGVDVFGIGEHHRKDFADSAPVVLLAAAAARTRRIRLTSAVTVLSANDPVRVFQEFATLDLIAEGRAEIVVGRGSFSEAFPLFGLKFDDYDSLFAEHLDLLLKIREKEEVVWSGKHRARLTGQGVYPRPMQTRMPIWLGVGGTRESFVRAGTLGLPLMVAIIGGQPHRFRSLIDVYRDAWNHAGHPLEEMEVGVHLLGYVADGNRQAADEFFPGYATSFNKVGAERGWPPVSRAQFDAECGPRGAFLVGDPATVAKKILLVNDSLGGLSRLTFQMSVAGLSHAKALHSIGLIGGEVIPLVKNGLNIP